VVIRGPSDHGPTRRVWYWAQKAAAGLAAASLGVWLYLVVDAAEFVKGDAVEIQSLVLNRSLDSSLPRASFEQVGPRLDAVHSLDGMPYLELGIGDVLSMQPVIVPELASWPSMQSKRIEFGLLKRGRSGWDWEHRLRDRGVVSGLVDWPLEVGHYLAVVTLPPRSLDQLSWRKAAKVEDALRSADPARMRAVQIVVRDLRLERILVNGKPDTAYPKQALGAKPSAGGDGVPTLKLKSKPGQPAEVDLAVLFDPDAKDLSRQCLDRVRFRVLRLGEDGVWRMSNDDAAEGKGSRQFQLQTGRHLMVVHVTEPAPQRRVVLADKNTAGLAKAIAASSPNWVRAVQVVVSSGEPKRKTKPKPKAKSKPKPQPQPQPQPTAPPPPKPQPVEAASAPPKSTSPPAPKPVAAAPTKSRDFQVDVVQIPPRKDNQQIRMRTEAPLPKLELERPPSSLLRWDELTLEDVRSLTSQWGIPFVAMPGTDNAGAKVPVVWMTGTPSESMVRSEEVGKLYGPHCLLLEWFAPEVQAWAASKVPSPIWSARNKRRTGFRLSGLLDAIVRRASERESLAIAKMDTVGAELLISRVDGRCRLAFRITKVVAKDSRK
jgi:hypothetical protein